MSFAMAQEVPPAGAVSDAALALQLSDVCFRVGRANLVDGVSLDAHYGEVLALVGPNGAGKSTLLRLLAGEIMPSSGVISLGGRPLSSYGRRELARRRAVLPQQTVMQFAFSAFDVVMMGRNPHLRGAWPDAADRGIAAEAMRLTETTEFRERIFPGLSGGEQSRVTFARVLAQESPVLLLDEPTAALDVKHQELAMRTARDLASKGACIIVIIHDLNLAAAYADRVALLSRGVLVACDVPRRVLDSDLLSQVFETPLRVIEDANQLVVLPERST